MGRCQQKKEAAKILYNQKIYQRELVIARS